MQRCKELGSGSIGHPNPLIHLHTLFSLGPAPPGASFFYKKGSGIPFEGQEVRAYGLLLKDLVARLDVTFEGEPLRGGAAILAPA